MELCDREERVNQQTFRYNYSDLRRILNQNLPRAGHFVRRSVRLPGRLNNDWTGIFNLKRNRVIALYRVKNGLCIIMVRSKSPYHQLIAGNLRARGDVVAVAWRKIPISLAITKLNQATRGMRVQGRTDRGHINAVKGWKRDERTVAPDSRGSREEH